MTLTEPIIEGAWYLLFNGQLSQSNELTLKQNEFGQALCPRCRNPTRNSGNEFICADTYQDCGHVSRGEPGVQVWFVPTDPAEVVAELRERAARYDSVLEPAIAETVNEDADLVESMLGLARCGEWCDGNCELTASGPTKAEAELAGLRAKAAEVIAELKAEVADLARHNRNEYIRDRSEALAHAADLVAAKLGVK